MVAEIFMDGGAEPLDGEWALEVYELFRKFVRRKEEASLDKHGFQAANIECAPFFKPDFFSQFHQNCAMFLLVSDMRFKDVDPQPFEDFISDNLEVLQRLKTGLMWVGDDAAPRFVHYTLVEYFAAAWLSANVAREAAARTVARSLIAGANHEGVGGGGGGVLLHFLDEMLAEDPSLHSAVHHTVAESINDDSLTHVAVNNVESQDPREGPQDSGKGSPNVLQLLFSEAQGSAQGITSLHLAAANGLAACARALIRHGADVNSADAGGRTPLHVAATEGSV
ncbi:Protein of unknown function [Gryllus bimaculatus]|nr:Protein of unknown function [Gryllus bimaculatus]